FSVLEGLSLKFGRLDSRVRSLRSGPARLGEVVSRLAEIHGDRRALTQDGTISYADLAASVDEIAGGLAQAGVEVGRPALVSTRNGVPLFRAILRVARAGAVPV